MKDVAFVLALLLAAPWTAAAQHDQHAALGPKLGTVHFETSCAASTRAGFDRAVALLHSFEYRPTMDAFNQVLAADTSCAIAYWGIALCQWGNPFAGVKAGPLLERGRDAAQKGLATGTPTPREKGYLAAADAEDATDKAAISPGPIAPARELLGEMLMEAGQARDALAAFEAPMLKEPRRFRGAYGAAMAAEAAGDRARAATLYAQVVAIAKTADGNRPELARARAFSR